MRTAPALQGLLLLRTILELEVGSPFAIGVHLVAEQPRRLVLLGPPEHNRARTVTKEHARVAVVPVDPAREGVGTNDERRAVRAIVQELGCGVHPEEEAGARGGQVEGDGASRADVARDAGRIAEEIIR